MVDADPAARRRRRGAAAADALRAPEGARAAPAGRRRDQQDRPRRRAPGRGARRDLRAVHRPGCQRRTSSTSRSCTRTPSSAPRRRDLDTPGTDLRPLFEQLVATTPPPTYDARTTRSSCSSPTCRPTTTSAAWPSAGSGTGDPHGPAHRRRPRGGGRHRRHRRAGPDPHAHRHRHQPDHRQGIDRVDIAEAGPGDIVAVAGHPRGDDRRHDHRPAGSAAAAAPRGRRADAAHDVRRQHLAAVRPRRQVRDQPPDQGSARSRGAGQRLDRGPPDRVAATRSRSAAVASSSWRCSSSRCGARASSCRCRGRRCSCARSAATTHEPYERITVDIPPEFIGPVQQALAARKAALEQMSTDADGRSRLEYVIPTRGLVGYRGQLLTETRGTALLHQIGEGYGPWAGEVTHRTIGVLVSDRPGDVQRLRPVQPPGARRAVHRRRRARSTRA